jgi:hypothetical protein
MIMYVYMCMIVYVYYTSHQPFLVGKLSRNEGCTPQRIATVMGQIEVPNHYFLGALCSDTSN